MNAAANGVYSLVDAARIVTHEEIIQTRLQEIISELKSDGVWKYPLILDNEYFVLLDGHHRYHAARYFGFKRIPALMIAYNSNEVSVSSWRITETVSKSLVIKAGLDRKLLPPKTSRHSFLFRLPVVQVQFDSLL